MFSIRRGVFETNSSSSHSLSIQNVWKPDPNVDYKSKYRTDGDAILVNLSCAIPADCDPWYEGYGEHVWSTAEQKLALAIRLSANQRFNDKERYDLHKYHFPTMTELEESPPFYAAFEIIKKYTGCSYIRIDAWGENDSCSTSIYEHTIEPIMFDDDVNDLDDFLSINGISLEQFLLDDNITVKNVYECY